MTSHRNHGLPQEVTPAAQGARLSSLHRRGHCKKLAPKYEKLGASVKKAKSVLIGKLKERAEKLENWKMKEMRREEKKKEKNELLRRQSSLWIEEPELEKKMLEAVVDTRRF